MARILVIGLTLLVGSSGGPSAPRIVGPRHTTDRTPTFRFVSQRAVRFRCAVDSRRLHRCARRYTPRLRVGRHTLRARAVNSKGRLSRTSVAHVVVARPVPHADQTIKVGKAPFNLAAGFGSVWVAVSGGLVRLNLATGSVVARISTGTRPWGVAVGEGAVWVGDWTDGTVTRVDPATNTVVWRVTVHTALGQGSPVGVAAGGGSVWAADNSTGEIWRLSPANGKVLGTAVVGDAHEFAGVGDGWVWVSSENGTVGELDPASGLVIRTIAAGADADFLGFSPGAVWVTNYGSEFIWRIDSATGAVVAKLNIGDAGAQGVAFDGSSLWVAMYNRGEVLRVDPTNGHVQRRVVIGVKPRGLAIAGGSVWVANSISGTVSRIGISG